MGCGRLFEGTAKQMHASLSALAALPENTLLYCGHEYTASNGKFALSVDPDNQALHARMDEVRRLRAEGKPTVPTTVGLERATNPFLRSGDPKIRQLLGGRFAEPSTPDWEVLAELRRLKDSF
jgi:hydroxyacylglutathione hydrolase